MMSISRWSTGFLIFIRESKLSHQNGLRAYTIRVSVVDPAAGRALNAARKGAYAPFFIFMQPLVAVVAVCNCQ